MFGVICVFPGLECWMIFRNPTGVINHDTSHPLPPFNQSDRLGIEQYALSPADSFDGMAKLVCPCLSNNGGYPTIAIGMVEMMIKQVPSVEGNQNQWYQTVHKTGALTHGSQNWLQGQHQDV